VQLNESQMAEAMAGHIAYMDQLYDNGTLFIAGPYMDDSNLGAGVVMAHSADEIRASLEQDPGYKAGIFTIDAIHPWMTFFNKPMGMRMTPQDMAAMMNGGSPQMGSGSNMPDMHGDMGGTGGSGSGESGGMMMTPGGVNFLEFPSKSVAESKAFYSKLFGWDFDSMAGDPSMAQMGDSFALWMAPGGMTGAFTTQYKPTSDGPVVYINVASVKAKLAEIEAAGGKTTLPSMKLPADWGYIGQFTDPHGNIVGLWSQAE
jgi:predicted enzyme related to lactoylglutathione lyase/uncharacterized protein YciI